MRFSLPKKLQFDRFQTIVQQFAALIFFVCGFTPITTNAQKSCIELFIDSPNLPTDNHEKSFKKFKQENDSRYEKIKNDPGLLTIMSKQEAADKFNTTKLMDRAMMGPLAKLFDLETNSQNKKVEIVKNKFEYYKIEKENKELVEKIKNIDNEKHVKILESVLNFENLSDNSVLVQVSSIVSKAGETPLQKAIKNRFQMMYFHMVNWVYRMSGLLENKTSSNLLMMDDVSVYANELKYFDFNLAFDKKVWEIQKSILTDRIDKYYQAKTEDQENYALNEISQVKDPFMPMAGMAEAKNFLSNTPPEAYALMGLKPVKHPVELKRYFKNNLEDPLGLLNVDSQKNEFLIRNKMIYKIIEKLPEGTPLEIHAHTDFHIDAYAKWGFVDAGLIQSEKFKGAKVHLLTATREDMLMKIKAIIDKNQ